MLFGLSSTLSSILHFSCKVIAFHLIQTVAIFSLNYFAPQYSGIYLGNSVYHKEKCRSSVQCYLGD
jgi:hypothetical protein